MGLPPDIHQKHGDFLYVCAKYITLPTSTTTISISWSYGGYSDYPDISFDRYQTQTQYQLQIDALNEIVSDSIKFEFLCHVVIAENGTLYYSSNITENVTFPQTQQNGYTYVFSVYRKKNCTLSFDLEGGSGGPSSISFLSGDRVSIPQDIPTKDGFVFSGWSDGSSTFLPGDSITFYDNTQLIAIWNVAPTPPRGSGSGLLAAVPSGNALAFSDASGFLVYN